MIDWFINCFIDCFISCFIDWLTDWSINTMFIRLIFSGKPGFQNSPINQSIDRSMNQTLAHKTHIGLMVLSSQCASITFILSTYLHCSSFFTWFCKLLSWIIVIFLLLPIWLFRHFWCFRFMCGLAYTVVEGSRICCRLTSIKQL